MRALIDTCVIMDAVQNREPYADDAQSIFLAAANQMIMGYVTAKEMTDIYYLTHRCTHDQGATKTIVGRLGSLFDILDTTQSDVRHALASNVADFEDAVMIETAVREEIIADNGDRVVEWVDCLDIAADNALQFIQRMGNVCMVRTLTRFDNQNLHGDDLLH